LKVLWAPWRMSYIVRGSSEECIFCKAVKGGDEENYVVMRSEHSIAMLNIFPYNTAHVMIAPVRHVARIEQLTREEVLDLFEVLSRVIKAIDQEYSPQGYNIGVNVGRVAGAGVESHVHVHVVPRWLGDTNFMPVIAGTKVMPEDLRSTYARLRNRVVSQDSIR
ncbi:MAG: HIT domain-containing protein, partial [Zestosphaera sp.]